jgi:hypothetical protein
MPALAAVVVDLGLVADAFQPANGERLALGAGSNRHWSAFRHSASWSRFLEIEPAILGEATFDVSRGFPYTAARARFRVPGSAQGLRIRPVAAAVLPALKPLVEMDIMSNGLFRATSCRPLRQCG